MVAEGATDWTVRGEGLRETQIKRESGKERG